MTPAQNGGGCPKSKIRPPPLRGKREGACPSIFSRNGGRLLFEPEMGQILGHFCKNKGYFFKIFARYAREGTYMVTLVPWRVNTSIYRLKTPQKVQKRRFWRSYRKILPEIEKHGLWECPPPFGENPYKTLVWCPQAH